jgi:hypothetical protein
MEKLIFESREQPGKESFFDERRKVFELRD